MNNSTIDEIKKNEYILAVDDETDLLDIYSSLLEVEGYQLLQASSPKKGLELLENNNVFLVISDFRMPKMDGANFCVEVKKKYPKLPVVFISAFADEAKASLEASHVGADEILNKPFNFKELNEVVKRFINQRLENSNNSM